VGEEGRPPSRVALKDLGETNTGGGGGGGGGSEGGGGGGGGSAKRW